MDKDDIDNLNTALFVVLTKGEYNHDESLHLIIRAGDYLAEYGSKNLDRDRPTQLDLDSYGMRRYYPGTIKIWRRHVSEAYGSNIFMGSKEKPVFEYELIYEPGSLAFTGLIERSVEYKKVFLLRVPFLRKNFVLHSFRRRRRILRGGYNNRYEINRDKFIDGK